MKLAGTKEPMFHQIFSMIHFSTEIFSWAFVMQKLLNAHLILYGNQKQSAFLTLQASVYWTLSIAFNLINKATNLVLLNSN